MRQQFQNQETETEVVLRPHQETEMTQETPPSPESQTERHRTVAEGRQAAVLNQEARRLRKQVWRSAAYCLAGTVTLGWVLTILILRSHADRMFQNAAFLIPLLFGLCSLLIVPLLAGRRIRRRLLREISDMAANEDVRAVGPLIDSLTIGLDHRATVALLTRLLPRLHSGDAALLDATHRVTLCRYLNANIETTLYKDPWTLFKPVDIIRPPNERALNFRIAILQAFANVGDRTTLPAVERLANKEAKTPAQKLLQAAEKCLPVLQTRLAQLQDGEMLLRASSLSESDPDTLLRAATANATEAPSEQLLRASLSETSEK